MPKPRSCIYSFPGSSRKTCNLHIAYRGVFTPNRHNLCIYLQPASLGQKKKQDNQENQALCKLDLSGREKRRTAVPGSQTRASQLSYQHFAGTSAWKKPRAALLWANRGLRPAQQCLRQLSPFWEGGKNCSAPSFKSCRALCGSSNPLTPSWPVDSPAISLRDAPKGQVKADPPLLHHWGMVLAGIAQIPRCYLLQVGGLSRVLPEAENGCGYMGSCLTVGEGRF